MHSLLSSFINSTPGLEVKHIAQEVAVNFRKCSLIRACSLEFDIIECIFVLLKVLVLEYVADAVLGLGFAFDSIDLLKC
jgi:hypothetical protein